VIAWILSFRRFFIVAVHLLAVVVANFAAFLLRFEGLIPEREWFLFLYTLPLLLLVRAICFLPFRLYQGLWRYSGIWDLWNIVVCTAVSTGVFFLVLESFHGIAHPLTDILGNFGLTIYPRSVFIIDSILLVFMLGGLRLARRLHREFGRLEQGKRILVYGAGDAGEMIIRDMKNNPFYGFEPVGFIDDDRAKSGKRIHGVKVLGTSGQLSQIIESMAPNAVLIAMAKADPPTIRRIVKELEPYRLPIKRLPNFGELLDGKVEVNRIRNLSIEDLLERPPVGLNRERVRHLIEGKRIMVTGAAGSIGSELCRQIRSFEPSALILYERHENSLFNLSRELSNTLSFHDIHPVIGDITDRDQVGLTMAKYAPQVIFHAAAHKQVPMMESHPCEAVKNNILGTQVVIDAAAENGAGRFILVSTDKAVNPANVMGTTKRIAELMVQARNSSGDTIFAAVRFGNVLGSSGSVVPLFMEQVKNGGPVTVTHKDMKRYMMLIREAVELMLHAAALARGGEIFVLSMGEQVRILDLARNLISLSGFVPEEEISIVFTGVRPGEKLSEELTSSEERASPSEVEQILCIKPKVTPDLVVLNERIREIVQLATAGNTQRVVEQLKSLMHEQQWNRVGEADDNQAHGS
jgi:FlaA1/EpsC-like NDP-sugar epimerase